MTYMVMLSEGSGGWRLCLGNWPVMSFLTLKKLPIYGVSRNHRIQFLHKGHGINFFLWARRKSSMTFDVWLAFFAACWLISLSPGSGALASMSSGIQFGFVRGYWNVIGLQLALALQIVIVAAGVGAILMASEFAFNSIKWFGVVYLIYLAVKQWQLNTFDIQETHPSMNPVNPPAMIIKGFLVNISNPKAIVFILAVLPQFINPDHDLVPQYAVMMVTMIGVDMIVMAGYTCLAAKVLLILRTPRQQRFIHRSMAGMFLSAASILALVHRMK